MNVTVVNATDKALDFMLGTPLFATEVVDSTGKEIIPPDPGRDLDCTACDPIRLFPGQKEDFGGEITSDYIPLLKVGSYKIVFSMYASGGVARSNPVVFTVLPK
jgi:hypothetical protein